jgi:molecular chaperone HscB
MIDHFAVYGLPRRYRVERDQLEGLHRELSKKLHPDRHAQAAPPDRLKAVQAMTALNDAYRTLKHPDKRAEHLLALHGVTIGEHDKVDQALLMEMLELREELEGADQARRDVLLEKMREREAAARREVAGDFAALEERGDRSLLARIKECLIELRYIHRYLEEPEE